MIVERGRPGERYNVGGGTERTNREVVRDICALLDGLKPGGQPHDRLIRFVADRPGHDHRYALAGAKLATELGWRPQVEFAKGLEATVRWYLNNGCWWGAL